jgi:recombinational DNA repair protein RecT
MSQQQAKEPTDIEKFLVTVKKAGEQFAAGAPLSVPVKEQARAIDRVVVSFRALAARNPMLYAATAASIGRCMALSALTGLVPGGPLPHVDLIPRKRKIKPTDPNHRGAWPEVVEIDWQIGWRGYIEMAARAGCRAKVMPVFDNEPFIHREGLEATIEHTPDHTVDGWNTWDALVGVYVVARFRDGTKDFRWMARPLIEERRNRSESWRKLVEWETAKEAGQPLKYNNGDPIKRPDSPWADWGIEMAMKTGLRFSAQRGLLAFDEIGMFAFGQDGLRDVLDASQVDTGTPQAQAGRRKAPAAAATPDPEPAKLTDHDPMGFGNDDLDGVEPDEDRRETVRVDPGVRDAVRDVVGGGAASGQAAPTPTEKPPSYTPEGDAEALRKAVLAKYNPWKVPLSKESAIDCLRTGLDVRALRPAERYDAAVNHGVQRGWWAWVANGGIKPVAEVAGG